MLLESNLRWISAHIRTTLLGLGAICVLAAAAIPLKRPCRLYVPPADRIDQGCINQGNDRRIGAPVVCWLQRHLSWKSEHEPRLRLWGNPQRRFLAVAWPPYLIYDSPDDFGHWRVFRVGFRYDRKWRGYIFPTLAWKCLAKPLLY